MSGTLIDNKLSADLDMGSATLSLTGNDGGSPSYGFDLECDMGSITINGANEGRKYDDNGKVSIDIECDMGSIDIMY